jgi:transcriptional regulator with XRE-family HTH domain
VATLAGVSIDYLVRLEQGRDTNPSGAVLGAIADALRLSPDERIHMKRLAAVGSSPELCPEAVAPEKDVPSSVRQILDRLDPTPAFVIGPYFDLLAWNTAWEWLMGPIGLLDDPEPNLARFTFVRPAARIAYLDWSDTADEQASALRSMAVHYADEPAFAQLVDELQQVPEFAQRWQCHSVIEKRRGTKSLRHPVVGELHVAYEVMLLPDDVQRLVTWLPADDASDAAIRRAVVGEASLRAV